jgi:ribose transport system ATP-binding protein
MTSAPTTVDPPREAGEALVEVRGLAKSYGSIRALRGVDVAFRRGAVHGLVGANGAGKSTLVRILAGVEQPDEGEIVVGGEPTTIHSPVQSARLGMAFIHQELNLVDTFTAAQNIALGTHSGNLVRPRRFGRVDARVRQVATRLGVSFDLSTPISELSVHQRWLITIARALIHDHDLIAMDEPTASLDGHEAAVLLNVARDLADRGIAVVFISHRLDEVVDLCDEVTVFRDGSIATTLQRGQITRDALVRGIVGDHAALGIDKRKTVDAVGDGVTLRVRGLTRGRVLRGVDFDLRDGEVLGIAGLVGSGRTELARAVFGADKIDAGSMELDGRPYRPRSIADAIRRGVAYVPEERRAEALFLTHSVEDNLHVTRWRELKALPFLPFTSRRASRRAARETSERLGITLRSGGTGQPVRGLSGGNQQKVVMGRWLATRPRVLILDEPSRGVDVGARGDIYARIRDLVGPAMSALVISSEFDELLECDRVIVMNQGRIVGELEGGQLTTGQMLRLCYSGNERAERSEYYDN